MNILIVSSPLLDATDQKVVSNIVYPLFVLCTPIIKFCTEKTLETDDSLTLILCLDCLDESEKTMALSDKKNITVLQMPPYNAKTFPADLSKVVKDHTIEHYAQKEVLAGLDN